MCQLSVVESKSATFPSERARHLLDDSVLESRSPRRGPALTSSSAVTNGLSLGKRPAAHSSVAQPACARVCLSLCRARRPHPQRGLPQESPCLGLCFLASGCHKMPGFVLILPVVLSTDRWKKQPDIHPRSAVPGCSWQSLAAALQGCVPGEPQAPAPGAKWRGCPRTARRATPRPCLPSGVSHGGQEGAPQGCDGTPELQPDTCSCQQKALHC